MIFVSDNLLCIHYLHVAQEGMSYNVPFNPFDTEITEIFVYNVPGIRPGILTSVVLDLTAAWSWYVIPLI